MNDVIFPRSPRETMDGWSHLPRYVDKIRLHLAGKLHADYQANFGKGFDGLWLAAAGLTHEQMIEVVRHTITDGQVCDWVRKNVKVSAAAKAEHLQAMLNRPAPDDAAGQERLRQRKAESGLAGCESVKTFVDLIEADEQRA